MRKRSVFDNRWKDYFTFNRRERRGAFWMITILMTLAVTWFVIKTFHPVHHTDFSEFDKQVTELYAANDSAKKESNTMPEIAGAAEQVGGQQEKNQFELFNFNPNNLPASDWRRLGFSDKQIVVIKNYETKGGKFRSKDDVKKIYSVTEKDFERIESYIEIPDEKKPDFSSKENFVKPNRNELLVDIGVADTTELVKLTGIGPAYARRIFSYRSKLGGFYNITQLKEVYGFTDSLFTVISTHVGIKDTTNLRKININSADFNELKNHPYIGYTIANAIISYRRQHGLFKEAGEIQKTALVNAELYRKLAPYLKVE